MALLRRFVKYEYAIPEFTISCLTDCASSPIRVVCFPSRVFVVQYMDRMLAARDCGAIRDVFV